MARASAGVCFLFFSILLRSFAQQCYFPDGNACEDTPCHSGPVSTCCGEGYICLSNNLCASNVTQEQTPGASPYVRGSCTDSTWTSNECPLFCINPQYDDMTGGEGLAKCPDTTLDMYYCIDGNDVNTNCQTQQNVVLFQGSPSVLTTIGFTAFSSKPDPTTLVADPTVFVTSPTTVVTFLTVSTTSVTTAPVAVTTTDASTASATTTTAITTTATTTGSTNTTLATVRSSGVTSVSTSQTLHPSASAPSSYSSSAPTATGTPIKHDAGAIAGGVIGGLVVLLCILAGIYFFLNHKKKVAKRAAAAGPPELDQDERDSAMGEVIYRHETK